MKLDLTRLVLSRPPPPRKGLAVPPPRGVAFAQDESSGPVTAEWPEPGASNFALIAGASGCGKTTMLVNLLAKLVAQSSSLPTRLRPCLVLPDPKNDLAVLLPQALAHEAPDRLRDLIILDPFAGGVPLNFVRLKVRDSRRLLAAALVDTISEATSGMTTGVPLGVQQRLVLGALIEAALDCQSVRDSSLLWSLDAARSEECRDRLLSLTASDRARAQLAAKPSAEVLASLVARMELVFGSESLERCIGSQACIDPAVLLGPGKIVIFRLGNPPGGLQASTQGLASILFRITVDTLMQRPTPYVDGHPALIVLDEVQVLSGQLSDQLIRLTTLGRAKSIGVWSATQGLGVVGDNSQLFVKTLFSNVNRIIVGKSSHHDAMTYAGEQCQPRRGESFAQARERTGRMIASLSPREFAMIEAGRVRQIRADRVDTGAWKAAANKHADAIVQAEQRYVVPATFRPVRLYDATPEPDFEPERRDRRRSKWG